MMSGKEQLLSMLKEDFNRWEELLAGMSEEQITAVQLPSELTVKDIVAHLWAWQQISVARLEAALHKREPEYPALAELGGETGAQGTASARDPDEEVDRVNAWIYESYRDKPWRRVYADWRGQFLRFLELGEEIPEKEMLETGRYRWLREYPLSAVLQGSYEHHEEHLELLLARPDLKGA